MRDPYVVLGVKKAADTAEIKKAFRRLAKKFHPDQSSDPRAKEKFAEANQAYEILGDEAKRAAFDRGEIDAEGKPKYHHFEGFGAAGGPSGFEYQDFGTGSSPFGRGSRSGGVDPSELFADLLGGAARNQRRSAAAKGEDVTATVTVPLEDAVRGGSARVTLPTGRTLDITIPPGIEDGKQIRLRGQGRTGTSAAGAGDALVTIRVARHKLFEVEGRDLHLDLPVTLYEAVLGAKLPVPTLDGTVEITLPPGANRGRTLRLRGKGIAAGGTTGDLLVTPKITLPEQADPDLATLMRRWEEEKPYDPRASKG